MDLNIQNLAQKVLEGNKVDFSQFKSFTENQLGRLYDVLSTNLHDSNSVLFLGENSYKKALVVIDTLSDLNENFAINR